MHAGGEMRARLGPELDPLGTIIMRIIREQIDIKAITYFGGKLCLFYECLWKMTLLWFFGHNFLNNASI